MPRLSAATRAASLCSRSPAALPRLWTHSAIWRPGSNMTCRTIVSKCWPSLVSKSAGRRRRADIATQPWEEVRDALTYCGRPMRRGVPGRVSIPHGVELRETQADIHRLRRRLLRARAVHCWRRAEILMHKMHREFSYAPGSTNIRTSAVEAFAARRGVCQDFAHIMIACLRSRGLAARYVSGYLRTATPSADAAWLGADASHAWVSVFCPPLGWIDLDPTNDLRVGTDHIVDRLGPGLRRCFSAARRDHRRRSASFICSRFRAGGVRSNSATSIQEDRGGQAKLSSRKEAKRGREKSPPGCETAAALECS